MTASLAPSTGGSRTLAAAVAPPLLQSRSLSERLVDGAAEVLGLALLAGALAAAVAVVYRWYTRERVPGGLPILVGLSGVAVLLNTTRALRQVIGETGDPIDETLAVANIVTILVSVAAARVGTDVGDRVATDLFADTADRVEGEVSRVVQAVGRVITVELPEEIDDLVGYDPVPDETRETLAGKSFVFPRRLTVAELRDRLVTRLKADYAVGHVDIDLADDGSVEYLALGSRAAGIGPTLPPETSAVAVRADPAYAASAGDLVQVWRRRPPERVLTAELRGTAGDVVTLAVDAADTRRLADDETYRLVTLPVESRPDREYASLLRAADETMATVTVAEGAPLVGQPLGALDVSVVAVRPPEGPVEPLPPRDRTLAPGDRLYLVATPEAIRRVDAAVRADPLGSGAPSPGSEMPPDRRVDATTPVADAADEGREPVAGTRSAAGADDGSTAAATAQETDTAEDADTTAAASADDGADATDAPVDTLEETDAPEIQALADDAGESADDGGDGPESPDDGDETGTADDGEALDLGDPDLATLDDGDDPSPGATDDGDAGSGDESGGESTGEESDGAGGADATADEAPSVDQPPDWTDVTDDGATAETTDESTGVDDAEDGAGDEERVEGEDEDGEEPTAEDLADLPGADPDEFVGTDLEELDDGEGSERRDESSGE